MGEKVLDLYRRCIILQFVTSKKLCIIWRAVVDLLYNLYVNIHTCEYLITLYYKNWSSLLYLKGIHRRFPHGNMKVYKIGRNAS